MKVRICAISLPDPEWIPFPAAYKLYEKQKKENKLVFDKSKKFKDGFDRGLVAEKIFGANESHGELIYCIKWAGTDEADNVPASRANKYCPQLVIEYMAKHLKIGGSKESVNVRALQPSSSSKNESKDWF